MKKIPQILTLSLLLTLNACENPNTPDISIAKDNITIDIITANLFNNIGLSLNFIDTSFYNNNCIISTTKQNNDYSYTTTIFINPDCPFFSDENFKGKILANWQENWLQDSSLYCKVELENFSFNYKQISGELKIKKLDSVNFQIIINNLNLVYQNGEPVTWEGTEDFTLTNKTYLITYQIKATASDGQTFSSNGKNIIFKNNCTNSLKIISGKTYINYQNKTMTLNYGDNICDNKVEITQDNFTQTLKY